jgi:hypothetical protein
MRDLNFLGIRRWHNRPFPKFTNAAVLAFEKYFGVDLPRDYVEFLRFANGGTLEMREYADPVTGSVGGLDNFYGLGNSEEAQRAEANGTLDYGNLWGETTFFKLHLLTEGVGVPFGSDGGGNRLFLDYRDPAICVSRFVIATRAAYRIAPTFDKFLDMLHAETDFAKGKRIGLDHEVRIAEPDQ